MDKNRLGDETSPYLLQHKDNPVHWQPWGPEAFAAAKAMDRPILLSIGYAACHWCHVMAHESFEDPLISAMMNARFVNIKLDREERPDLDQIYQHALALMGEQGGWPLTMFLTPDGEPFWGGTYFPPNPRWGRPGFPQVIEAISNAYSKDREAILKSVSALRDALGRLARPQKGGRVGRDTLDQIAERLLAAVDMTDGGIAGAPKFPQVPIFELLWRAWKRTGREAYRDAVLKTLDAMCEGGIYDHLGGGFARYSTDTRWLVPHFEKMLYDNAELIDLLSLVYQDTKSPLYRRRVEETLAWVEREMLAPQGGFASSLDADSEHEEGKYYVWSEAEIDRLLGERATAFKQAYDVTAEGNWEGHTILNRRNASAPLGETAEAELARDRAILFAAREKRIRPGRDDKVLADWNGLMIAALANAGLVFARPEWIALARRAFGFVRREMMRPDGRLAHSWRDGKARHPANVDDYADLCRAALVLYEASGEEEFLAAVRGWLEVLDRHYWDADGGYFLAADDTPLLISRAKTAADAAVPAGNGVLVGVLARLYQLTGEAAHRERAEAIVGAFSGEVARNFFPLGTLLNNADFLDRPVQIVLAGERGDAALEELQQAAYRVSLPNRIVEIAPPGRELPDTHPAHGKGLVAGKPAAYVCEGPVCSIPVTEPEKLVASLAEIR